MKGPGQLLAGAANFRDVGGLLAVGGQTRAGVLFRSGHLAHIDASDHTILRTLGLKRVIDLRDDDELRFEPSNLGGLDVVVQRVPLFLGSAASLVASDISLAELNQGLLNDSASQVVEVVRGIVVDQPVLVHCTVGKDRTGLAIALTLAASGVTDDAIVADYARTEGLLSEERNRRTLSYLRRIYPGAVHLEELVTRSPADVMRGVLSGLREAYGAPVEYLRAHGLRDDEIAALGDVLIERSR